MFLSITHFSAVWPLLWVVVSVICPAEMKIRLFAILEEQTKEFLGGGSFFFQIFYSLCLSCRE